MMRAIIISFLFIFLFSFEKCKVTAKKKVFHIYDYANIISSKQYDSLKDIVDSFRNSKGIDIMVYTKGSTGQSEGNKFSDSILSLSGLGESNWVAIFVYSYDRFIVVKCSKDLKKYFDKGHLLHVPFREQALLFP